MKAEAASRPDSVALADAAAGWRAAYVHIPFCAQICPYCDYTVVSGRAGEIERYVGAVEAEIGAEPEWRPLDAVHFGGGTPSRVPPHHLARLLEALRSRFGVTAGAEVALEANPEDWSPGLAAALAGTGFNRVSFGAQSFDGRVLATLGRGHGPEQSAAAVMAARRAGFSSVGLDLVFGTPGESPASWRRTLDRTLELRPDHVSTYALTIDDATPLGRAIAAGATGPDPDDQADKYEVAQEVLKAAGLVRYEVAHFARPGHAGRYQLVGSARGDYAGFGLGAAGHRGGVERVNLDRLDAYLSAVAAGTSPVAARVALEPWERDRTRLFVGVRRAAGAALGDAGAGLVQSPAGARLLRAGVIEVAGDRVRVIRPLLTDEVGRAILALAPPGVVVDSARAPSVLAVRRGDC